MSLNELAKEIREINAANGWDVFKCEEWADKYKVPAIIALIQSEPSEGLEAFRDDDITGCLEEMADTVIRVLDFVGGFPVDFDRVVQKKLEKNKQRGFRHGGKKV